MVIQMKKPSRLMAEDTAAAGPAPCDGGGAAVAVGMMRPLAEPFGRMMWTERGWRSGGLVQVVGPSC